MKISGETVLLFILLTSTVKSYRKHRRKKIRVEYEYLPQEYEERQETKICTLPSKEGGGGGGSSVWGYLTAAVVAANVAANIGKVSFEHPINIDW